MLLSCRTLEDDPLNTSDHLPILSKLSLKVQSVSQADVTKRTNLNWNLATQDGSSSEYASQVEEIIRPLLRKDYSCVAEIDSDLTCVTKAMLSISSSTIPPVKLPKDHRDKRHGSSLIFVGSQGMLFVSGRKLAVPLLAQCMSLGRNANAESPYMCLNVE